MTPDDRESARQRALQQEAERQAKAAQRAQAAQQRSERRETAAQRRAQQREVLALQRQQQGIRRHARRAEAAQLRAERREESVRQRWDRVHHKRARQAHLRRPRSWPAIGLLIAGAVTALGAVLAGVAGKNPRSALATTAGWLIILAILVALVCTTAALWRWLRKDKYDELRQPVPSNQNGPDGPGRLTF